MKHQYIRYDNLLKNRNLTLVERGIGPSSREEEVVEDGQVRNYGAADK